jgi:hypothetical protein
MVTQTATKSFFQEMSIDTHEKARALLKAYEASEAADLMPHRDYSEHIRDGEKFLARRRNR